MDFPDLTSPPPPGYRCLFSVVEKGSRSPRKTRLSPDYVRCGTATSSPRELTVSWGHSTETAFPSGSALATLEFRSGWAAQKGHQKEGFWEEVILGSYRLTLN